uniref:Uncharacterized protein n=1 Tax=Branchiostoma floridae TaxID=7739 RepID=C3Y890_BRAFL|eukprot:XP_002607549.1 hypothetical protein BRAFLDRAFT_106498 [Branchiostoma floridae]
MDPDEYEAIKNFILSGNVKFPGNVGTKNKKESFRRRAKTFCLDEHQPGRAGDRTEGHLDKPSEEKITFHLDKPSEKDTITEDTPSEEMDTVSKDMPSEEDTITPYLQRCIPSSHQFFSGDLMKFAMRRMLPTTQRDTLFKLCDTLKDLGAPAQDTKKLTELELNVHVTFSLLERDFPLAMKDEALQREVDRVKETCLDPQIHRPIKGIQGMTREVVVALLCNIESQEQRRLMITTHLLPPEHPRAGTSDDVDAFIALLHGMLGPIFDHKAFRDNFSQSPHIFPSLACWQEISVNCLLPVHLRTAPPSPTLRFPLENLPSTARTRRILSRSPSVYIVVMEDYSGLAFSSGSGIGRHLYMCSFCLLAPRVTHHTSQVQYCSSLATSSVLSISQFPSLSWLNLPHLHPSCTTRMSRARSNTGDSHIVDKFNFILFLSPLYSTLLYSVLSHVVSSPDCHRGVAV